MEGRGDTGLMGISEELVLELGEERADLDLSDPANVDTLSVFQLPLL